MDTLREIGDRIDRRAAPIRRALASEIRFVANWFKNPLRTGAVAASSKALAQRMAACVDPAVPGPVLELGPGTGMFTEALIRRGFAQNRLVLVEFNPEFARHLKRRFPRATIITADVYDRRQWAGRHGEERFAGIVSGLPLLTQPPARRQALLEACFDLARPGAPFVQFTYSAKPPVKPFDAVTAEAGPITYLNLPPARIFVYRRSAN